MLYDAIAWFGASCAHVAAAAEVAAAAADTAADAAETAAAAAAEDDEACTYIHTYICVFRLKQLAT